MCLLVTTVSSAKTAEPIGVPFGVGTQAQGTMYCIGGEGPHAHDPQREGAILWQPCGLTLALM